MNRGLNKTIKGLTLAAMILIMAALLINNAVYTHVHVMPDGTMRTHAHPFSKAPDSSKGQSHKHTNLEFFIFQGLDLLMITTMMAGILISFSENGEKRWYVQKQFYTVLFPFNRGRAPPHCI